MGSSQRRGCSWALKFPWDIYMWLDVEAEKSKVTSKPTVTKYSGGILSHNPRRAFEQRVTGYKWHDEP